MFPETPQNVPLFASHDEFKDWMPRQIEAGAMHTSRHLWISVRPNGEGTPVDLNRLELRSRQLLRQIELQKTRIFQVIAKFWSAEITPLE